MNQLYLLCKHFEQEYAVPIGQIVEVITSAKYSLLPEDRSDLLGLMNLRGEVIPILNLNRTVSTDNQERGKYVVICNVNNKQFGFPIEQAIQVIELNSNKFQLAQGVVGTIDSNLVQYLAIREEKTVLIIELERMGVS